jgi:hypothetical protein
LRKLKLEIPRQYYGVITEGNEMLVIAIHNGGDRIQMMKLPLLKEPAIGSFLDLQASRLYILGEQSLNLYSYCLRSKQLSSAFRTYTDAINLLEVE